MGSWHVLHYLTIAKFSIKLNSMVNIGISQIIHQLHLIKLDAHHVFNHRANSAFAIQWTLNNIFNHFGIFYWSNPFIASNENWKWKTRPNKIVKGSFQMLKAVIWLNAKSQMEIVIFQRNFSFLIRIMNFKNFHRKWRF